MDTQKVAEGFPPGDYIREELKERGWTQSDLAFITGEDPSLINRIITGNRKISARLAHALGDAFGTGAQVWLNLQNAYLLSVSRS